jgi:hypothetical protein
VGGGSSSASVAGRTQPPPERTAASPVVRHLSSSDGDFAALILRSVDSQIPSVRVVLPNGTRVEVPAADPRQVRLVRKRQPQPFLTAPVT